MNAAGFRRLALALAGAEERAHMGHPDFRVGGRVFATLGHPGPDWAMVKLTPGDQGFFCGAEPDVFVPVKGAWGLRGCTSVRLAAARVPAVRAALKAAWQAHAPSDAARRPSR